MHENKLIGIYLGKKTDISVCSELTRRVFKRLVGDGVTYDRFIFPYADWLLLSGDKTMFGSHSLLYGVSGEQAARLLGEEAAAMDIRLSDAEVREVCLSPTAVYEFFSLPARRPKKAVIAGGYSLLAAVNTAPWAMREQSRKLCSFAEQICMDKETEAAGYCSDGFVFRKKNADIEEIAALYEKKTGGLPAVRKLR